MAIWISGSSEAAERTPRGCGERQAGAVRRAGYGAGDPGADVWLGRQAEQDAGLFQPVHDFQRQGCVFPGLDLLDAFRLQQLQDLLGGFIDAAAVKAAAQGLQLPAKLFSQFSGRFRVLYWKSLTHCC